MQISFHGLTPARLNCSQNFRELRDELRDKDTARLWAFIYVFCYCYYYTVKFGVNFHSHYLEYWSEEIKHAEFFTVELILMLIRKTSEFGVFRLK